MKLIVVLTLIMAVLAGCSNTPKIPDIIYQDKYIPIVIVPHPPEITRPEYYARQLTEEQKNDIGELSKAYVISSQEADNYIAKLRLVYDKYEQLAINSERRLKALMDMGIEIDGSLVDQSALEVDSELQALSVEIDEIDKQHSEDMRQSLSSMNE